MTETVASIKKTRDIRTLLKGSAPIFRIGLIEIKPLSAQQNAAPKATSSAINILLVQEETSGVSLE